MARYDYYRLYRVFLKTEEQLKIFQEIEQQTDSYTFYGHPRSIGQKLTLMVAAHKIAEFVDILQRFDIENQVLEYNIQSKIDAENLTIAPPTAKPIDYNWKQYFHLSSINDWLDDCAIKNEFVSTCIIGNSYEKLPIKGLKIAKGSESKPTILIEAGIHAREWISPATTTYILNEIIYSNEDDIKDLRENFNWYFFPTVNPDGYRYTFESDRLWRKNRQPYGWHKGVDLNRNFESNWNGIGSSSDPASYDFAGGSAFSEPETKALADFITENFEKENIRTYIALHSYSQLVMFPYGHVSDPIANYVDHKTIVEKARDAIKKVHGKVYNVGSKNETIYPSSGGSIDWAYSSGKIPISITFELRGPPDSSDMFILPADQIIPTAQETLSAFIAIINESRNLGYYK